MHRSLSTTTAAAMLVASTAAPSAAQAPARTIVVSVDSRERVANAGTGHPSVSADGRFVAFSSTASNLVPGDRDRGFGGADIFVRDVERGVTRRVSITSDGRAARGGSRSAEISADGRYVAFISRAANLVPGDTNRVPDAFVHDLRLRRTTRVSVASGRRQARLGARQVALSPDGRWVAFLSDSPDLVPRDTNGSFDAFVHDRRRGRTTRASVDSRGREVDFGVFAPLAISAGGRVVAFASGSDELVPGDRNRRIDMFAHDRRTRRTVRANVSTGGEEANHACQRGFRQPCGESFVGALSDDGRTLVFTSSSSNLVPGDTNRATDVFARDLVAGTTTRVSVDTSGAQAFDDPRADPSNASSSDPFVSADGRYVGFVSFDAYLDGPPPETSPDTYVHDRVTGITRQLADSRTYGRAISGDGRWVAFTDPLRGDELLLRGPLF